jgi:hypothetical protein
MCCPNMLCRRNSREFDIAHSVRALQRSSIELTIYFGDIRSCSCSSSVALPQSPYAGVQLIGHRSKAGGPKSRPGRALFLAPRFHDILGIGAV